MGVNWRRAGLPLKLGAEDDDSWIVGLWLCLYLPPDTGTRLGTLFRDTGARLGTLVRDTGTLCANVRGTLEGPVVDRSRIRSSCCCCEKSDQSDHASTDCFFEIMHSKNKNSLNLRMSLFFAANFVNQPKLAVQGRPA